jgi:hypothetical protein
MTEGLIRGSKPKSNTAIIRVLAKRRPPFQREGQTPCTRYILLTRTQAKLTSLGSGKCLGNGLVQNAVVVYDHQDPKRIVTSRTTPQMKIVSRRPAN